MTEISALVGVVGFACWASLGVSGGFGGVGGVGEGGEPEPGRPPLLISTIVPWMETPAASIVMKPPGPEEGQRHARLDDDVHATVDINLLPAPTRGSGRSFLAVLADGGGEI